MLKIIKVKPIWKKLEAAHKELQEELGFITDLGFYFTDEETEGQRRKVSYDPKA